MFVGHYAVSFVANARARHVPLWALFLAVQLLELVYCALILLGIEHARIVPGITATRPIDLYDIPYSHSLVAAVIWSAAAWMVWRLWRAGSAGGAGAWLIGVAVLSHWFLDLVVHRPDLPLYDNSLKVGLGLWNHLWLALTLECALALGATWYAVVRRRRDGDAHAVRLWWVVGVGVAMHLVWVFGPSMPSVQANAVRLLVFYAMLTALAWLVQRPATAAELSVPA